MEKKKLSVKENTPLPELPKTLETYASSFIPDPSLTKEENALMFAKTIHITDSEINTLEKATVSQSL